MDVDKAVEILDNQVWNPCLGLPEEIFRFVSRMTPIVNVDLLIKDEDNRTLLAWRDDELSGTGWHVPGGILRYKERLEARVELVIEEEIKAVVKFDPLPIAIHQIHSVQNTRGHFISILYNCFLSKTFTPQNCGLSNKDQGFLMWHKLCPSNLIKVHEIYRKYI
jgi:colanic acid biosynthesis protein WcaH